MSSPLVSVFFFFNDTAPTEIYTLSLHDALPIFAAKHDRTAAQVRLELIEGGLDGPSRPPSDRKSTRLNSSHITISYAVFCLKKKKTVEPNILSPSRTHTREAPVTHDRHLLACCQ